MIFNKFKKVSSHSNVQNDLPDGSSIMPPLLLSNGISGTDHMILRQADYIGSFPVESLKQKDQVNIISKRLESMRNPKRCTPVILAMGLSGIKIYNQTGQKIYMGHAMRRISYATCDPEHRQFSFLCREPNAPVALQYCHVFLTETSDQAEELNNIVGDAFKMSYARIKNINEKVLDGKQQQQQVCSEKHKSIFQAEKTGTMHDKKSSSFLWTTTSNSTQIEQSDTDLNLMCLEEHLPSQEAVFTTAFPLAVSSTSSSLSEDEDEEEDENICELPPTNEFNLTRTTSPDYTSSLVSGAVQANAFKSSTEKKKSSNASSSSRVQREALSFCEKRCAVVEVSSGFMNVPGFRSSSELEMTNIVIPPVASYQHPLRSVNSTQGFRPISAGSGYGSSVQSPAVINEYSGIQVANAATNAFRQASAFGGCPVVAMKETIDKTSTAQVVNLSTESKLLYSKPSCDEQIDQIPLRKIRSESSRTHSGRSTIDDDLDLPSTSNSNEQAVQAQPPPPLPPLRCDSLSLCHYDATHCANKDSGVNTTSTSTSIGSEDSSLSHVSWYHADMPRDAVLSRLAAEDEGGFIIRESVSHAGCFALSVKVPKHENAGIAHYLIQRTQRGVKLKGLDKEWPSLQSLVVHLTVMPEMLPCPLRLARPSREVNVRDIGGKSVVSPTAAVKSPETAKAPRTTIEDAVDFNERSFGAEATSGLDFEDADYQRLSDFSSIMADFRVR